MTLDEQVEELVASVRALALDANDDVEKMREAAELMSAELARLRADPSVTVRQFRHDLRNRLGALIGYADLVIEETEAPSIVPVRTAALNLLERLD